MFLHKTYFLSNFSITYPFVTKFSIIICVQKVTDRHDYIYSPVDVD